MATEPVGWFISPMVTKLLDFLESIYDEKLAFTLKGRLDALTTEMNAIHDNLRKVEKPGTLLANDCLKEIRKVADALQGLYDDIEIDRQNTINQVQYFFLPNYLPDDDIISDTKRELVGLKKIYDELNANPVAGEEWKDDLDPGPDFEGEEFIGREDEKNEIVEFLLSENNNDNNTCAIVGVGGVGKTALAQVICQHDDVKEKLQLKWAPVGFKKFNLNKILPRIGVTTEENNNPKSSGTKKPYLFVLDDLWDINYFQWNNLKKKHLNINKGNKILITTRNQRIAEMAAKDKTVFLNPLTPLDCLPLIQKFVKPYLFPKCDEIKEECEGVPLAAITLGIKLSEGTIRGSDIWSTEDVEEQGSIMNSLKFSYDHLKLKLKDCFAYHVVCNGFLHKERLTQMWTAQGFIEEPDVDNAFEKLKHASFFHDVKEHIFLGTQFKVLKLFRTLILLVSEEYADITVSRITGVTRHVSLSPQHHAQEVEVSRFLGQLRTVVGLPEIRLLTQFKGLRVLVLFGVEFESSDISFSNMTQLKYLDLSQNRTLEALPESLGDLSLLRTLRVDMCEKLKALLPNEINTLTNLRYLYASSLQNLKKLPEMSYFTKLETLEILDCPRLTNLPEGFRSLTSLESLTIEGCPGLQTSLSTVDGLNILPDKMKLLRMKRSDELTEIYKRGEVDDRSWIKEVYRNGVLINPAPNVEPSPSSSAVVANRLQDLKILSSIKTVTDVLMEGSNGGTNGNGEGSSTHHHQSDRTSFGVFGEISASTEEPLNVSRTSSTQQSLETYQYSVADPPDGNGEGSSSGNNFRQTAPPEQQTMCLHMKITCQVGDRPIK